MSVLLRLVWPTLRRNPLRYFGLILQFAFACAAGTMAMHFLLQEGQMLARIPPDWHREGVWVVAAPPDRTPPQGVASIKLLHGSWGFVDVTGAHSEHAWTGSPKIAFVNAEYMRSVTPQVSVGQWFSEEDGTRGGSVPVVLNAVAAKGLGHGNSVLGKQLGPMGRLQVVGILAENELIPLRVESRLQEIMNSADPIFVVPDGTMDIVFPKGFPMQYERDGAATWLGPLSEADRNKLEPAALKAYSMERVLRETHEGYQSMWGVLQAVAGLILGLATIGFTGVVLSALEQRWREYAVRIALGATPRLLIVQLLGENLVTTTIGGILGALIGTVLSPLMPGSLPGLQLLAPVTVVAASVVLGGLLSVAPLSGLLRIKPDEAIRAY